MNWIVGPEENVGAAFSCTLCFGRICCKDSCYCSPHCSCNGPAFWCGPIYCSGNTVNTPVD